MTKYTYNYDCLMNYCKENNIKLNNEYSNIKVTRDTNIIGSCLSENCKFSFNKKFRQLKRSEAFCKTCSKIRTKEKVKNTCIEKYGVEYALQSKEVRESSLKTIKEK